KYATAIVARAITPNRRSGVPSHDDKGSSETRLVAAAQERNTSHPQPDRRCIGTPARNAPAAPAQAVPVMTVHLTGPKGCHPHGSSASAPAVISRATVHTTWRFMPVIFLAACLACPIGNPGSRVT